MVYDMFPDYDELYNLDDCVLKQIEKEFIKVPAERKSLKKIFGDAI